MRSSIECPAVGLYNPKVAIFDHRAYKWKEHKEAKSRSERNMKIPAVGAYDPLPVGFTLFDSSKVS